MREIERTKYLANAIDRVSTSCLTVGVFAPIAAALYSSSAAVAPTGTFVIGAFCWLSAAVALHFGRKTYTQGLAIMNGIQIFAFIILPAIIAAGGWIVVLANERHNRIRDRLHPGE